MADLVIDDTIEAIVLPNGEELELGKTPTGNIDITQAGVTDVSEYATATVPQAVTRVGSSAGFAGAASQRKFIITPYSEIDGDGTNPGYIGFGTINGDERIYVAIPTNTTVTPTESAQTIGGANYMMEGAVTVNAIPSNYVGSGVTQRSSSDLTASGATVTVPSGHYASNASKSVASGTEGTPTATKGAVSSHSVTVTPSVTNSAGYISGGTHTGTRVTVSASELVSGSQTVTQNGTVDCTNLAEIVVAVSGGGGALTVATKTLTLTAVSQTLSFTSLSGQPKYWFCRVTSNVSSSGSTTYYYITDLFYDGTNIKGNTFRIGSTRRIYNITSGISQSYSNGTLTITGGSAAGSQPGQFYGASGIGYELVYIY